MKKLLFVLVLLFCLFPLTIKASTPLDEITEYTIKVNPRDDATLDLEYQIKWKVLNSTKEGPLEWVKIGVPNKHVDSAVNLSDQIDEIYYYSDSGSYIRVDLDRKYYKGETVDIHFSFHQSYIYTVDEQSVFYAFKPGWFDDIQIKHLTVYWKADNVLYTNSTDEKDGYLIWDYYDLNGGETITTDLKYDQKTFPNINLKNVYEETKDYSTLITVIIIVSIVVAFLVIGIITSRYYGGGYYAYRGFSTRHYFWGGRGGVNRSGKSVPTVINSGGGHSRGGGSSCACACACACAGGGRAGCSRKDFYHPNLKIDEFKRIITEDK